MKQRLGIANEDLEKVYMKPFNTFLLIGMFTTTLIYAHGQILLKRQNEKGSYQRNPRQLLTKKLLTCSDISSYLANRWISLCPRSLATIFNVKTSIY